MRALGELCGLTLNYDSHETLQMRMADIAPHFNSYEKVEIPQLHLANDFYHSFYSNDGQFIESGVSYNSGNGKDLTQLNQGNIDFSKTRPCHKYFESYWKTDVITHASKVKSHTHTPTLLLFFFVYVTWKIK